MTFLTWNIENFKTNKSSLHFFVQKHQPDFIFISEPMLYQCDLSLQTELFKSSYNSSLNSMDLAEPDLPLRCSRSIGGTMIMWRQEHDPFVKVLPFSSTSFLPILFCPPELPPTIHIAVYLPTAGRESEFIEALSGLDACISELYEKYPDSPVYLRGDFNVGKNNYARIGLLKFFSSSNDLLSVPINHPTYHHFVGGGRSDSQLDKIYFSSISPTHEQLTEIHCRLVHPLVDSHHDVLLSKLLLNKRVSNHEHPQQNISAPKTENNRVKIYWDKSGIDCYSDTIAPLLQLIQETWLSSSAPSRSFVSLALQSTNRIMREVACSTNKAVYLGKQHQPRKSFVPRDIRKSQCSLLKSHMRLHHFKGSKSALEDLKIKHKRLKADHRSLLRRGNSQESIRRDTNLYNILKNNPTKVFETVRATKKKNARKIGKLMVDEKVYVGETVPDGFYDSLLHLKSFDHNEIQNKESFSRYRSDYSNIVKLCSAGLDIPRISFEIATKILKRIRSSVNDVYSITANHFLNAGNHGIHHFHLLLNTLITDINNISLEEVNTVHAVILFKGHSKDKSLSSSYRTISTCPLVAKALDIFLRDLNIDSWNEDQAPTQFLGQGSNHELASLLLTEIIQHSLHVLHQPLFILYLDAKSAFDRVIREILVRNLFFTGTSGKELLYIDKRLENRKTFAEWDKVLMGPIIDKLGVEQGGVNSGDFYKIYAKPQLQLAHDSQLGVRLSRNLTVSAIGQADDTLLVSNSLHSLQNLLQLSLYYCSKANVELCPGKTKLQVMSTKKMRTAVDYLKEFSPVNLCGNRLEFCDETEHVGVIRSVHGNLPNILNRISAHKKAVAAVLHTGAARHHRANPIAGLRLEKVYGFPVLLSGIGSLILSKSELSTINQHHKETVQHLTRLLPNTPRPVCYFLAGSLPGEAYIHLRQISLLGMICNLQGSVLHQHAVSALSSKQSTGSWFHQVRNTCLLYKLPHPLTLLSSRPPPPKKWLKNLAKKKVIDYWEQKLREETTSLESLKHFQPQFMSLEFPHPIFMSAQSSPYEVTKAGVQALLLSGRYRTERLSRYWSTNPTGSCLCPSCNGLEISEDVEHILLHCPSLSQTRASLAKFTMDYASKHPDIQSVLLAYTNPTNPYFVQFLVDCSVLPEVISLTQVHGKDALFRLFKVTRAWCYSLHRKRLQILGRWSLF